MLRVGLTGGIGSGKTAVADFFSELDVAVIDSDLIARQLVEPGTDALAEIVDYFGPEVINKNGELERSKLAQLVFANGTKKQQLERILHPRVHETIAQRLDELKNNDYVIVAIPLLIEAGFTDLVDRILVVDCEDSLRIDRVRARDGRNDDDIKLMMKHQLDRTERLRRADDIIDNTGSLAELKKAVADLHRLYSGIANQ